jgi:selenide, water dikinase
MTDVRLTTLSHGAGCACKLSLDELRGILAGLPDEPATDGVEVLVGHLDRDDAAVWRVADGRLAVATTDFFTPVVDDPATWGRIAATNAVSDVYAMGGRPQVALNLVGWPRDLPFELLAQVLAGAQEVAAAAGYVVLGGHSIDSAEPFFGLAVIGEVAEEELLTNAGALPGQALVLSKALGTGIVMTAAKRADAGATVEGFDAAVASMTTLNREAARLALAHGATAATDVTGFGLLGHLHGLASASQVSARIVAADVPVLPGVTAHLDAGLIPGGTQRNADQSCAYASAVSGELSARTRLLLADAQTSGGLLVALPSDAADALVAGLRATGLPAARIGAVTDGPSGAIAVEGTIA